MRAMMIFLYTTYMLIERVIKALFFVALSIGFGWCGWKLGSFAWSTHDGWTMLLGLPLSAFMLMAAIQLFMRNLPSLTPGPKSYNPGRARTASLSDLVKAGILRK